ncbi:MAG: hypothetical protein WC641_01570 [Patescibacteria group bacterium]
MNKFIALVSLAAFVAVPTSALAVVTDKNPVITDKSDTGVCGDNQVCREDLKRCEDDLKTAAGSANDLTKQLEACTQALDVARKEVKKIPPPVIKKTLVIQPSAAVCMGAHIVQKGLRCECESGLYLTLHNSKDGTQECVLRAEWVDKFKDLEGRIPKTPANNEIWGAIKSIRLVLQNSDAPLDKDALMQGNGSVVAWLTKLDTRVNELNRKSGEYDKAFDVLCPKLVDKPEATLEERCQKAPRGEGGSRVTLEIGAEARVGYRPGAKGNAGLGGFVNVVYSFPQSDWAFLLGGYVGGLNDKATGPQYVWGLRTGPRAKLSKTVSLDLLAYVEQYYSTHGAGFGADRSVGFQGLQDKGMGFAAGANPRLNVCLNPGSSLCLNFGVQVGYSPGIDRVSWRLLQRDAGGVVTGTLGIHYAWNMF